MRSGVIAKKLGMTRLFMEDGRQIPVTVLQMDGCQVVAQRTSEKDGYTAVQLAFGERRESLFSKAERILADLSRRASRPLRGRSSTEIGIKDENSSRIVQNYLS